MWISNKLFHISKTGGEKWGVWGGFRKSGGMWSSKLCLSNAYRNVGEKQIRLSRSLI